MRQPKRHRTLEPDQLLTAVASLQPALVDFLRDLVSIRSVNGQETETAVAARIVEEAERLNLPATLVAKEPERPNVIVQWGEGPRGFALIGHMDTVAAGDESHWSHPPFAGHIVDNRLDGRGAADNKAGLACALYTLALLRDEGLLDPTTARVIVAGVVDEESGASSPFGVRALLDGGHLPVQGAIYTYTSDIVCIGHRGLLRLQLEAKGRSVHSGSEAWSRGEEGVNAVTGLAAVLLQLEQLHLPAPAHPAFDHLAFTITPGTLFQGGEFESMVPGQAKAMVDVRLMPGQGVEDVVRAVRAVVEDECKRRPGLAVDIDIKNQLSAAAIDPTHPLVRLAASHAAATTGRTWPIAGAGPANEGYMLIEAGIPTLCGFGPTGGGAHAADEWVYLQSLPQTVAMYSAIIHDYLREVSIDEGTA